MKESRYYLKNEKVNKKLVFSVISDLHGCDVRGALAILEKTRPDYILAPGDIFERVDSPISSPLGKKNEKGFELLRSASKIAPTLYSMGNHEIGGTRSWALGLGGRRPDRAYWNEENLSRLAACGVTLLDDSYVVRDGIAFGGISSGILSDNKEPNTAFLDEFCRESGLKILLCHHPEYYEKYLFELDIDLIVSGHAHGGQWCFFGRGMFAPGQGFFPKYTHGVYDERLAVSRGLKRGGIIPRLFNPAEIVTLIIE